METGQYRVGREMKQSPYLVIATVCLLLAAIVSWSGLMLVVVGHVIPWWAASAVLFFVSLIFKRVHTVRQRSAADRTTSRRPALLKLVVGLLTAAAVLGSAFGAVCDLMLGADYRVLHPTGAGGCTAVVREASFLKLSWGEVYAVGSTGMAWRESGSWTVDDMYRPVAGGTYELHWSRSVGTFRVSGTTNDPLLSSDLHPLDCD